MCPTVCTLSSEFKIHNPLGCSGYAFTFACCSLLSLQGLFTIQMNPWSRYNTISPSPW